MNFLDSRHFVYVIYMFTVFFLENFYVNSDLQSRYYDDGFMGF